ncbi:MAG: NACHT domain-containing protein [Kiritimatiellae bacterium]|nr:NACHT domain-containing protein [Kiritimatiellia bacterium]
MNSELIERAKSLSRYKKERYLLSLSEDDFRDKVVRPLFLRRKLEDGRDLCGPLEAGKDAIFVGRDPLGLTDLYAVQTKRGNMNMGAKVAHNIVQAITQLKTAKESSIMLVKTKERKRPTKVVLCVSGKINENARSHIIADVNDPRLVFMDVDDLIPDIDEHYPEFWFNIDANIFPYLKAVREAIEKNTQLFTKGELIASNLPPVAASNEYYAPIRAVKYELKPLKVAGEIKQVPDVVDLPVISLTSRKERLILLLGSAGAGKSTAMLRMIYMLCEKYESDPDNSRIPVFLKANHIDKYASTNVLDLMYACTEALAGSIKVPFKTDDLTTGKVVLFVDALDELANLESQKQAVRRICEFHVQYPLCQIIITSRDTISVKNNPGLARFATFTISSMNYKQAKAIIKRLVKPKALKHEDAEEFLRKLQEVHGIELNPLIVTVFAAGTEGGRRDIPANITELFKKFTEYMLGRWDESKGLDQQYHAPLKDYILREIAAVMHARRTTSISIHEFKHLIAHELENRGHKADIEMLTDEIINRSSLFRVLDDNIEFRHLMLQEFFAGRAVTNAEKIESFVIDGWWRMPLVFFFGENPGQGKMILELEDKLSSAPPPALYDAAITLGLATQASYLSTVAEKIPALSWVINSLASVFADFQQKVVSGALHPLHAFLRYYLYAREAVASNLFTDKRDEFIKMIDLNGVKNESVSSLRMFWFVSGLIESGQLTAAEEALRDYNPQDQRLILGIHLSVYLAAHHKVVTRTEKSCAMRIIEHIAPKLHELRKSLLEEFRSELLEVQDKKIRALEADNSSKSKC